MSKPFNVVAYAFIEPLLVSLAYNYQENFHFQKCLQHEDTIIPCDFGVLWDICYICETFGWSNINVRESSTT